MVGLEGTSEELLRQNNLRSLEEALRANDRIRHYSNRNDFLTTDDDLAWLADVLGESNVTIREEGGHFGNMYRPDVQEDVMSSVADLLEEAQGTVPEAIPETALEAESATLRLTIE